MKFFINLSLKYKLVLIIVFVNTIAFIISISVFFAYDKIQFEASKINELKILAKVIGDNNNANLLFNGKTEAKESLRTLMANKSIKQAQLYRSGVTEPFASFECDTSATKNLATLINRDTVVFFNNNLLISKPVVLLSETIGCVVIEYSLSEFDIRINQFIRVSALILTLSMIVSLLVALQLQKIITTPIFKLTRLMANVSLNKDYSLRAQKRYSDEVGLLSDGFNQMLSEVEKTNEELKLAKEQAERSLLVKEQFLANMSHEIRTPMNAVLGLTDLLLQTEVDQTQHEYLNNIRISAENLLVIINDILDFSKIEAGKIEFEEIDFNLHEAIEHVRDTLIVLASARQLYFSTIIEHDVPEMVHGDLIRFKQILLNLVGNAIKFTNNGGVTIHVSPLTINKDWYDLEITVVDTGIGIPKEKVASIFDSFNQASSDTTRRYGGTGLGLTITKQLVELQGGELSVESEVGKGSKFKFKLRFKHANTKIDIKKKEELYLSLMEKYKQIHTNNPIKVLLVEDNKMNQLLAKAVLEKNHFLIDLAEDGKTALSLHEKNEYDVILMDLHMPEMDGYEATSMIRNNADSNKRNIPVIALTAAATKNEVTKCISYGMTDFISKPYKPGELLEKILKLTLK